MPDFDATEHEFVQAVHPLPACPDPDLLIAANQGVLPPDVERSIQKHLLHCGICKTLLNDLASLEPPNLTAKQDRHIRSGIPGMPVQNRTNRVVFAVIAAAAILITVLWLIHHSHSRAGASSAFAAAALPANINVPLTKLDPPTDIVSDGEWHSSASRNPAFELATAFAAYRQNKYQVAATDFSVLAQRYPENDIVFLYLGVSQLFLDQNEDALASLGRAEALAKPERQEAASWYHALAALRLQDTESKSLFEQLCSHRDSPYSSQACGIAKQLQPGSAS